MIFENRQDAGQQLARTLVRYRDNDDVTVLALPRGGVVVGAEVARELHTPLGLVLVRKIGHPAAPEYAIGAVAENEPPVYNKNEIAGISSEWLKSAEESAREVIERRRDLYYSDDFVPPAIKNRIVILVDDGMATGLTMDAAARYVTSRGAHRIVVAVPVASPESIDLLEEVADEVIVLDSPENFSGAVGAHYRQFEQVDDYDVEATLLESSTGI